MSSIQKWHVGMLVLLWGASPFAVLLAAVVGGEGGVVLVGSVYLLFCGAVTWIWFGGREGKR